MARSIGFFCTNLNWLKLFGLVNPDTPYPLDILDLFKMMRLRSLDMTAADEARNVADWRDWDFHHGYPMLPLVNDWGLHGLAVDRSVEMQTYDESGVEDYEEPDDDPTEHMSMEELYAMMGREQTEEYLIGKYMPPDELDLLYEFDLPALFPDKPRVVCLASFTMLYSKCYLAEDSEDGEHLLRGFQLEKISSQTEFAVTFRQALPS
jgi:hypothetical protein